MFKQGREKKRMSYDQLKRLEKQYSVWLQRMPFFESSKVATNENGKYVIQINYKEGMSNATKKEIATELGDLPLKFNKIKI
jgi:hypothetical protein